MLHKTIEIKINEAKSGEKKPGFFPTLTTYLPDNTTEIDPNRKRKNVIICPGGGYGFVSEREAEPIALKIAAAGHNAFVLRYSTKPATYPRALMELAESISYIRENAVSLRADRDSVYIGGFSAGGHLAACLANLWNSDYLYDLMKIPKFDYKPNGLFLAYPVITSGEYAHSDSFKNLLGKMYVEGNLESLSMEKHVSIDTPKTFIWHTVEDDVVDVRNTLDFVSALKQNNVSFELHIYPEGAHGAALGNFVTSKTQDVSSMRCAEWIDKFLEWMSI